MKKQLLKLVYFFLRVVSLIYILNLIIMMSGNSNIEATNFIRNDINSIRYIYTNNNNAHIKGTSIFLIIVGIIIIFMINYYKYKQLRDEY